MKSKDEMFKEMNDARVKLGLLPIKKGEFDKTYIIEDIKDLVLGKEK